MSKRMHCEKSSTTTSGYDRSGSNMQRKRRLHGYSTQRIPIAWRM
uniref:Uncharacterized protein n=1 Tax=Parascaris equorum TaxID=6256 RepID=A0A914RAV4_PAREQ